KQTRTFDSGFLSTSSLDPGKNYYLGWIIQSSSTIKDNNIGKCPTPLVLFDESTSPEQIELNESSFTVQQGCAFYLAANSAYADNEVTWWWDYGNGYFVQGARDSWITNGQYISTPGEEYSLRLKVVNRQSQAVVQRAAVSLTVTQVAPTIEVGMIPMLSGQMLKLNLHYSHPAVSTVSEWIVDWGQSSSPSGSSTSTLQILSNRVSLTHYYAAQGTYAIRVRVPDGGSDLQSSTWFTVGFYTWTKTSKNVVLDECIAAVAPEEPDVVPLTEDILVDGCTNSSASQSKLFAANRHTYSTDFSPIRFAFSKTSELQPFDSDRSALCGNAVGVILSDKNLFVLPSIVPATVCLPDDNLGKKNRLASAFDSGVVNDFIDRKTLENYAILPQDVFAVCWD
ncbi:MAG: hypothetical protein Q4G59_07825, partial [Planctomycetia bacterium]|nr:hypothetical protein [Planctomycetia bacterium]